MQIVIANQPKSLFFTSRKNVPRYLYHLTTKKNADKILISGAHISYPEYDNLSGFFMFDFNNFLKYWTNPFKNFSNRLFYLTANNHNSEELALLRISTKNLDKKQIKIRSQFSLFNNHQLNSEDVSKAKHYTRKKHPIEYIYLGNILPENIEKVGECKVNNNILMKMYLGLGNAKELIQQLVKGKTEERGIPFCKNLSILKRS